MSHADRVFARLDLAVADKNLARRRREHSGQDLNQSGFARSVVANEPDDLVAPDGDVDVAQRVHRAEMLLYAFHANDGCEITLRRHHSFPSRNRLGSAQDESILPSLTQRTALDDEIGDWSRKRASSPCPYPSTEIHT